MSFIKERIESLFSKKLVAGIAGVATVETWPQALVVAAYILAQAYVDSNWVARRSK